ncbi:FMRFamide receptor [Lingula anatina]|uniref:FMRFamide receptor n=1 Tax=Lingula anatina TaxID=7574 RepID=A0A1S3H2I6_LINAN|nr:FMRFamide receptor [Lingula anatina]|eukprot:XP_013379691.1 FMRFamide receptor [Lingula anatina]
MNSSSNCTYDFENDEEDFLAFQYVIEIGIIGPMCIFGLIGNALSFVILFRENGSSPTFFLLRTVAVADSLMLVTSLLMYVVPGLMHYFKMDSYSHYKAYTAVSIWPFAMMAQTSTIWMVLVVAIERYIAICWPTKARMLCTISHARKEVIGVTIFSVLFNIPRFFENYITEDGCSMKMSFDFTELYNNPNYRIFYTVVLYSLVNAVIPLITVSFININLTCSLRQASKARKNMGVPIKVLEKKSESSITLVLVLIVVVFIICQVPAMITHIWGEIIYHLAEHSTLMNYRYFAVFSNVMVILNSSLNFLIYCAVGKRFRKLLKVEFRKLCCRKYQYVPSHSFYMDKTELTTVSTKRLTCSHSKSCSSSEMEERKETLTHVLS